MKKFLVTLIVIILAVSVGFGVFFLVKDNEVISLKTLALYKDIDDPFEVSLDMKNSNSYTKVTVSSTDESVVEVGEVNIDKKKGLATATFKAVGGGNAKIVFKTNNAKFRNISCDVVVCDGSLAYPYRIDSAEKLTTIGTNEKYTTSKNYVLTNNIDLGTLDTPFAPIDSFAGTFNGQGYTISNLAIKDDNQAKVGLFREILKSGVVKNVKLENASIETTSDNSKVGLIAGVNQGTVSLIEVKSAVITNNYPDAIIGGVVGVNESLNSRIERNVAKVDRVSINANFGTEEKGIKGTVGAVVGKNYGGTILNTYSTGKSYVKDVVLYGGITAINEYLVISGSKDDNSRYNDNLGAKVKDSYSIMEINGADKSKMGYIIGTNTDASDKVNQIVGNYYVSEVEMAGLKNNVEYVYGDGIKQNGTTNAGEDNLLKDLSSLVSYKFYNKKAVVDKESGTVNFVPDKSSEIKYYWDLSVWKVDSTLNDGYPILTFEDEHVDENFESTVTTGGLVSSLPQLNDIRNNLNGTYFISESVDLSLVGDWVPIGTEAQPFEGTVIADPGVEIKNLTVSGTYDYAGLFGVLGESANISGLNLVNVNITANNGYTGAIAGKNKGTIFNCSVKDGALNATKGVGGVVGENLGKVADVVVTSSEDKSLSITKMAVKNEKDNFGAGGIAGVNHELIAGSSIVNEVSGKVVITSKKASDDANPYTSLGGVVGQNFKNINNVKVILNQTTVGDVTYGVNTAFEARVGGIAGYSTGTISNAYVSATMSANVDKENSMVGGIVGYLNANKSLAIEASVVENSFLNAHYTAGIVADMTTSYIEKLTINKDKFSFNGAIKVSNINNDTKATIEKVAVENTVTLEGKMSGGIVGKMTKGIVKDAYSKANLSADTNAGIVYSIGYNNSSKEGGVIYNAYSACTHKQGKSYAVSTSEVHNNWSVLGVGNTEKDRTVGFIFNYYYLKSDNMADPKTADPIDNLGIYDLFNKKNKVVNCRTDAEMKKTSTWTFLTDSVWSVKDGAYPSILACEAVKF